MKISKSPIKIDKKIDKNMLHKILSEKKAIWYTNFSCEMWSQMIYLLLMTYKYPSLKDVDMYAILLIILININIITSKINKSVSGNAHKGNCGWDILII